MPVEVWPIQEFTYLQPSSRSGARSSDRIPAIERYWAEADPEYCDGEGAESFGTLLERVRAALERLEATPDDALVYVFSHGQFIQAVRSLVIDDELSEREKMRQFWEREVRLLPMLSWWNFHPRMGYGDIFQPASLSREFDDGRSVGQG